MTFTNWDGKNNLVKIKSYSIFKTISAADTKYHFQCSSYATFSLILSLAFLLVLSPILTLVLAPILASILMLVFPLILKLH